MPRAFATCWIFLLLLGCAEGNSIYHSRRISPAGDRIVTMDAKQRNLLVTRDRDGDWRMCAEAAPDVFSALSASASLGADIATKSGRAAAAIAEAAGTIERTQTVNLLRESMYRTCERYLNGSIGRGELVVQAARDQRAMIKVLAIEQLTRAARSPATILMAPSTSAVTVDGDTAAALIKGLSDERSSAKSALDTAAGSYDGALAKGKCDKVESAPADDSGDPKLSDWTTCKAAAATKAARQKDFDDTTARFDKALAIGGQLATQNSAATGAGSSQSGGGTAPGETAVASVAKAVTDIVVAPDIDEVLMFCIAYLDPEERPQGSRIASDPPTSERCRDILSNRARRDEQLRGRFFDAAGGTVDVQDFDAGQRESAIATLNGYLTSPSGASPAATAEHQRRMKLAQAAAAKLRIAHAPPDISGLATDGDPAIVGRLLTELRAAETDAAGKADLGS